MASPALQIAAPRRKKSFIRKALGISVPAASTLPIAVAFGSQRRMAMSAAVTISMLPMISDPRCTLAM